MMFVKDKTFAALVVTVVLGTGAGFSAEANAQNGCNGKLVATQDIRTDVAGNGPLLARLQVFYKPQNNGTNIACVIHYGRFDGVPLHTSVSIRRCGTRSFNDRSGCGNADRPRVDDGIFKRFAGPVVVTNANRRCVSVTGHIQVPNQSHAIRYKMEPVDCDIKEERSPDVIPLW